MARGGFFEVTEFRKRRRDPQVKCEGRNSRHPDAQRLKNGPNSRQWWPGRGGQKKSSSMRQEGRQGSVCPSCAQKNPEDSKSDEIIWFVSRWRGGSVVEIMYCSFGEPSLRSQHPSHMGWFTAV